MGQAKEDAVSKAMRGHGGEAYWEEGGKIGACAMRNGLIILTVGTTGAMSDEDAVSAVRGNLAMAIRTSDSIAKRSRRPNPTPDCQAGSAAP